MFPTAGQRMGAHDPTGPHLPITDSSSLWYFSFLDTASNNHRKGQKSVPRMNARYSAVGLRDLGSQVKRCQQKCQEAKRFREVVFGKS